MVDDSCPDPLWTSVRDMVFAARTQEDLSYGTAFRLELLRWHSAFSPAVDAAPAYGFGGAPHVDIIDNPQDWFPLDAVGTTGWSMSSVRWPGITMPIKSSQKLGDTTACCRGYELWRDLGSSFWWWINIVGYQLKSAHIFYLEFGKIEPRLDLNALAISDVLIEGGGKRSCGWRGKERWNLRSKSRFDHDQTRRLLLDFP